MTSIMISVDLEEGTAMKRKASKKAVVAIILCAAVTLAAVPTAIFFIRGNNSGVQLPAGFEEELSAQAFENSADVRIMSSNLLVHYKSWAALTRSPEPSSIQNARTLQPRCRRHSGEERHLVLPAEKQSAEEI